MARAKAASRGSKAGTGKRRGRPPTKAAAGRGIKEEEPVVPVPKDAETTEAVPIEVDEEVQAPKHLKRGKRVAKAANVCAANPTNDSAPEPPSTSQNTIVALTSDVPDPNAGGQQNEPVVLEDVVMFDAELSQGHEVELNISPSQQEEGDHAGKTAAVPKAAVAASGKAAASATKKAVAPTTGKAAAVPKGEPVASTSRSAGMVSKAAVQRPQVSRPFYHEHIAGWKYFGAPQKNDYKFKWAGVLARNDLWHEMQQACGKPIVIEDVQKVNGPDDNDSVNVWTFKVLYHSYKRGKPVANYFASIEVTTEKDKDTYFVFSIDNPEIAREYNCSVETLRNACSVVFNTIVMKCTEPEECVGQDVREIAKLIAEVKA